MSAVWRIAALVLGLGGAGSADDADLVRLESVWNEAHLKGDVAALETLWAEGLVVTVPRMPRMDREAALSVARTGRIRFERYETSDIATRVHGDTAVVTGRLDRARRRLERLEVDRWQFTKVYLRRDGRWQVLAFHASEAPDGR